MYITITSSLYLIHHFLLRLLRSAHLLNKEAVAIGFGADGKRQGHMSVWATFILLGGMLPLNSNCPHLFATATDVVQHYISRKKM